MAVFASLPRLRLIVVDEEHDPSYKQQEGARYSARDLAVYRGRLEGAKVLLGSATPSLESWQACDTGPLPRAGDAARASAPAPLPAVRLVDMNLQPKGTVFSPPLLAAIAAAHRARRAVAGVPEPPRLCAGAGLHRLRLEKASARTAARSACSTRSTARCAATTAASPSACRAPARRAATSTSRRSAAAPSGWRSSWRELLAGIAPARRRAGAHRAHGRRHARALKGALEQQLAQVHAGEVDVLVGTQMVTKGHDFRRITLVAAVNPDSALFSSDFRAPERLFSLLMQAAGRAGRDAAHAGGQRDVGADLASRSIRCSPRCASHDYPAVRRAAAGGARAGRHAALRLPGAGARRRAHAGGGAGLPGRRRPSGGRPRRQPAT